MIVAATAMPFADGFRFDGDLVLAPGGAGLGDLDQFLADPASLAGILLVSNIALYVPLAFFAVIGFHQRRHLVLVGCLILSLMVEATQFLLLGRVAATDDVILNMTGAALGLVAALALIGRSTRVRASLGMRSAPYADLLDRQSASSVPASGGSNTHTSRMIVTAVMRWGSPIPAE